MPESFYAEMDWNCFAPSPLRCRRGIGTTTRSTARHCHRHRWKPVNDPTVLVYYAGVKQGFSTFCRDCYLDCGKRTITDAHGNFIISGLDPQLCSILLAAHDGYGSAFTKKLDPAKLFTY
jgi:hypothetical protein